MASAAAWCKGVMGKVAAHQQDQSWFKKTNNRQSRCTTPTSLQFVIVDLQGTLTFGITFHCKIPCTTWVVVRLIACRPWFDLRCQITTSSYNAKKMSSQSGEVYSWVSQAPGMCVATLVFVSFASHGFKTRPGRLGLLRDADLRDGHSKEAQVFTESCLSLRFDCNLSL